MLVARSLGKYVRPMMTHPLFRWFAAPDLQRPDLPRRARALWVVSWPLFAVVAVVLGMAVLVEPDTAARRAVTIGSVGLLVAGLHQVSRAGRPMLASWILVIGLSVVVTQRAWITGGIHAPVAVFYVLFIVMAGALIGARGALITAGVCMVGAIVLTIGTAQEWLTPKPGAGPALGGFVFVVLAIALALVLQALVNMRQRPEVPALDAVQMLVHDMRSPMQVVLAHLELLRADVSGESAKDVEAAIDGATTLNRMATSLLDAGRLEAGRMPVRRTTTDVAALVRSVLSGVSVLQPARNLGVEIQGNVFCECDAELTRRVVENLVGNAMKHTPIDGRVRVVVTGSRDRVSIAVHDEGPGVPVEKRARVFEPFRTAEQQGPKGYDSWGVGLAFCRLAVEAHGGAIRVESGDVRGSVFVADLPR
jgi:signal transduction histidine kinase